MKVTSVRAICLSRIHEPDRMWLTMNFRTIKADAALVVIKTDEGLIGIGEASPYGNPRLIADWVRRLEPILVGRDPRTPNLCPQPTGPQQPYDCAVAGIDCALWDLKGKIAGAPVARLLRSDALQEVPVYASGGCNYDWRDRPETMIEEVLGYRSLGYTSCKIRLGSWWAWDSVTPDRFLGLMRELCQEIDGGVHMIVDGNQRLSLDQAIAVGRGLTDMGIIWFEEPIDRSDLDGYLELQRQLEVPLAAGEGFRTLEQFMPFIERRAYDIVQPDVSETGITHGMQIAALAEHHGLDVVPHNWHNGLMTMANSHFVAALPRPRIVELCMIQGPLQWGIISDPPRIEAGCLRLSDQPGFGVSIHDGVEELFPYVEGDYFVSVTR
jgi:L-alanine-DL-glutamate epimerase-like enolase superfamily enzyme